MVVLLLLLLVIAAGGNGCNADDGSLENPAGRMNGGVTVGLAVTTPAAAAADDDDDDLGGISADIGGNELGGVGPLPPPAKKNPFGGVQDSGVWLFIIIIGFGDDPDRIRSCSDVVCSTIDDTLLLLPLLLLLLLL